VVEHRRRGFLGDCAKKGRGVCNEHGVKPGDIEVEPLTLEDLAF
jgi:hypothetical protein